MDKLSNGRLYLMSQKVLVASTSVIEKDSQTSDAWQWQPDPVTGYSVRGAYQLLTSQDPVTLDAAGDLIWRKHVPLKVSVFAWRLLRDRLPTKANLVTRGIILPEAHYCVTGCEGIETARHLFFTCGTFGSLWSAVRFWLGFFSVDPQNPADDFLQFTHLAGGRRAHRSLLQLLWLVCVMDRKKSSPFQQINKNIISIVGQG
ncbi:hypothetical protein TSUD_405410 [Trifolium subterraneum]|uniref:Reverse transcriptase zinc-binding domain-containing protein n=1 Tax=Trifolium subterraneum TaxID=3900 RepID=A0A2Z6NY93_TRISU|nr:hypothetical protein TSUD_405410 [Trifolium subterraneum]